MGAKRDINEKIIQIAASVTRETVGKKTFLHPVLFALTDDGNIYLKYLTEDGSLISDCWQQIDDIEVES